MLEPKTIRLMNELIQDMTQSFIDYLNISRPVNSEDLRALAELARELNVPSDPPGDPAPVVGFVVPDQAEDPDGDEE
ncbi:hypothetical protein RJP21_29845 [Paenibacillus sp. VCA1]|uniref:hypothetical protein n=1 Tax=Paenibacillus sp. VCA1 TaxID=3039148 RepID=UPI002871B54E|nr:hypothetical protein [Paenibacillus sp. VCA1]MDR9857798.1 hypothetical protein [Paenibacillus sp. VCA1]